MTQSKPLSLRTVSYFARTWLLMLIDGAERMGKTPIDFEDLHSLVYFSNALAPVYDLVSPDGYILKYKRGPFYPNVQWDLDRMALQHLVRVHDERSIRDKFGTWFAASYSVAPEGFGVIDEARRLAEFQQQSIFLTEIVRAFVLTEAARSRVLVEKDTNYEEIALDGLVAFEGDDNNFSSLAAKKFEDANPEGMRFGRRGQLHLYMQYLRGVSDVVGTAS